MVLPLRMSLMGRRVLRDLDLLCVVVSRASIIWHACQMIDAFHEFVGDAHQRQADAVSAATAQVQLVITSNQDRSVRLAASVNLKNTVKRKWEEVASHSCLGHRC